MLNPVSPAHSQPARAASVWECIKTYPLRSGLAICGLASIAAVVLRKKQNRSAQEESKVEDFTPDQQAMLGRIREICDEYHSREGQANSAAI